MLAHKFQMLLPVAVAPVASLSMMRCLPRVFLLLLLLPLPLFAVRTKRPYLGMLWHVPRHKQQYPGILCGVLLVLLLHLALLPVRSHILAYCGASMA